MHILPRWAFATFPGPSKRTTRGLHAYVTAWKMIMALWHVASYDQYALILATVTGLLVFKIGIFEGMPVALAVHGL